MAKKDKKQTIASNLNDLTAFFEKKYGKGSIMSLGDDYRIRCDVIPSQSMSLDYVMGVGGYPRGRIIEIFGPESSGKTTLALHAVASVQALGGKAAFIDAEHALSPQLMINMGINPNETLISQPDHGEQALEMCELLVESNTVDLVIVDSVAALVPLAELEGDINASNIGAQARMMSQFLRRIASRVKRSKTAVIFINQIRMKIGVMFGSNETTPGGRALKFYSSMRLDIRKIGAIKASSDDKTEIIGHAARVKVIKNKVATPFKIAELPLIYGKGIDYEQDLVNIATKHGIISKRGSWLVYNETKLGMGATNAAQFLKENEEIKTQIDQAMRGVLFPEDKYINEESDTKESDTEESEIEESEIEE